jgi:hypothetical protein
MKILALDQAGKSGWAIGSSQNRTHRSGRWQLPGPNPNGDETPVFVAMRKRLTEMWEEQNFELIAFEEPLFIDGKSPVGVRIQLLGLVAIIQLFAHDHKIPAYSVALDDWRKHFLGANCAPRTINMPEARREWWKEKAVEACSRRFWDCHSSHDEAEALGILDYALWQADQSYEIAVRPDVLRQKSHIEKEGAYCR